MGIYEHDDLLESYVFRICQHNTANKEPTLETDPKGLPRWVLDLGTDDTITVEECEQQTLNMIRTMSKSCLFSLLLSRSLLTLVVL